MGGLEEDVTKKRTRRAQKFQRAVVGATLQDIMAKRNQKPEVRKAQREQAVRAAKDQKKARHRRQQRTPPRPVPAGLAARDKYFAFKFLWQFVDKYFAFKILWQFVQ